MSAFDELHRQLSTSVADRAAAPATPAPGTVPDQAGPSGADRRSDTGTSRGRWWTARPFALALVGLTIAGSATAATITIALHSEPSAPVTGKLPPLPSGTYVPRDERGRAADTYSYSLAPGTDVGKAQWCLASAQSVGRELLLGQGQCSSSPGRRFPVVIEDTSSTTYVDGDDEDRPKDPPPQNGIAVVVDDRVRAVRLGDGRVLAPRTDPSLPAGFRLVAVPRLGEDRSVAYLGEDGREIADAVDERSRIGTIPGQRVHAPDPAVPVRPWAIRTTDEQRVPLRSARELVAPPAPVPDVSGRPFLAVSSARLTYDGHPYEAIHYVDARDPSALAAEFPGARPGRSAGTVRVPGNGVQKAVDARRTGPGWLTVSGPSPSGRLAVLRALQVGPGGQRPAAP